MRKFQPNAVVKVVVPPEDDIPDKGSVTRGALAVIVDGREEFPDFYDMMCQIGVDPENDGFIFVKWVREDPRWKGRIDGAYSLCRFEEISGKIAN